MTRSSAEVPLPIVVGVDGTADSGRALEYAVQEARRHGCGLRLVHATSEASMAVPMLPMIALETMLELGHRFVEEAASRAGELAPELEVTTEVLPGVRGPALAQAGEDARMVVLGHRHLPAMERVLRHSTTNGTIAHAHCPVVSVPASWTREETHGVVLVGVDDSQAAQDALATAFAEASARGARLTALHSWRFPSAYDDLIASRIGMNEWRDRATRELDRTLAPWRELYPEVVTDVVVVHDDPAHALASASYTADLAVVGRSGSGGPLSFHVGGIARAMLRTSRCPVVIVPVQSSADSARDPRLDESEVSPQT